MKLTLAILSFYLCSYAIELGNPIAAFCWAIAGLAFASWALFSSNEPKDPPSFS